VDSENYVRKARLHLTSLKLTRIWCLIDIFFPDGECIILVQLRFFCPSWSGMDYYFSNCSSRAAREIFVISCASPGLKNSSHWLSRPSLVYWRVIDVPVITYCAMPSVVFKHEVPARKELFMCRFCEGTFVLVVTRTVVMSL